MSVYKPKKNKSILDITIDDSDINRVLKLWSQPVSQPDVKTLRDLYPTTGQRETKKVSQDKEKNIERLLPRIVADKIKERIPDGFDLTQISITGEISGKLLGFGLSGTVTAVFTKATSP